MALRENLFYIITYDLISVGFVQIERKTLKFANLNFYVQTARPIE